MSLAAVEPLNALSPPALRAVWGGKKCVFMCVCVRGRGALKKLLRDEERLVCCQAASATNKHAFHQLTVRLYTNEGGFDVREKKKHI